MERLWLSISITITAFVSSRNAFFPIFLLLLPLSSSSAFTSTEAHQHDIAPDPIGNVTIKWDLLSWTPDGYVAVVTMYNYQRHRGIGAPGWTLGWTWARKEVIWSMMGSQTTEQGDCSMFRGNVPHCCQKRPSVVDLLPGTPYNQQVSNCCKGGVLTPWAQNSSSAISSFQISVGSAATSRTTVKMPIHFTLKAPGPGYYTCGASKIVTPTQFITRDKKRILSALMTWNVVCRFSLKTHQLPN